VAAAGCVMNQAAVTPPIMVNATKTTNTISRIGFSLQKV
jgi:hypothetical protein